MARSRLRSAICQTLVRFENRVLILLPHTPLMTFSLMLHSESLGLHNNGLEGTIPSRLTALTDLALLYLDNNRLTGNIPESIGNLSNIGKIDTNSFSQFHRLRSHCGHRRFNDSRLALENEHGKL